MPVRLSIRLLAAIVTTLAASTACGSLKQAPPDESTDTTLPAGHAADGTATSGSSASGSGGLVGPAALPAGFCCTTDADCRYHACVDVGGQKMCLDDCRRATSCGNDYVADGAFTCDWDHVQDEGRCVPPAGFACIPPSRFTQGTRRTGECCAPRGNGTSGEECEGNLCNAVDDGPFFCSRWCAHSSECPPGMICGPTNACVFGAQTYTCR